MADPQAPAARLKPHIAAFVIALIAIGISRLSGVNVLWLKAMHVVFVVSWFSGIFYLPRLFVYHAMTSPDESAALERFSTMERKLYRFTTPFMWLSIFFGGWMLFEYGMTYLTSSAWLHAKLFLVGLLVITHFMNAHFARELQNNKPRSHRFYRVINEVPVLMLFAIVILVIVKPF